MHNIHSHSVPWKANINLGKCNEHACCLLLLLLPAVTFAQGPPGSHVCLERQFPCDHQGCLVKVSWWLRMCQNSERRTFRLEFLVHRPGPLNPRFSKMILRIWEYQISSNIYIYRIWHRYGLFGPVSSVSSRCDLSRSKDQVTSATSKGPVIVGGTAAWKSEFVSGVSVIGCHGSSWIMAIMVVFQGPLIINCRVVRMLQVEWHVNSW